MDESTLDLDVIFSSLADSTRRDILRRLAKRSLRVSAIATPYDMSLAAISKHLQVLENAKLVTKHKQGKERIVRLSPTTLKDTADYLHRYDAYRHPVA